MTPWMRSDMACLGLKSTRSPHATATRNFRATVPSFREKPALQSPGEVGTNQLPARHVPHTYDPLSVL